MGHSRALSRVKNGTNCTSDGTSNDIVRDLRSLVLGLGHEAADLENAAETGIS